jgi:hypothetical protein
MLGFGVSIFSGGYPKMRERMAAVLAGHPFRGLVEGVAQ